ncbi:MAG: threonylcarbamoyl-AMP synthase [Lachnospiraceae bacterium]|nr:threonylcarbamoyl-AMP synthase [Lachnospiraceae bacterium]
MTTEILSVKELPVSEIAKRAAAVLSSGGLSAFPTETVYGLGGNGLSADSAAKIYAAKGRPSDNPLILHIGKKEQLKDLVTEIPEKAKILIDHFWPGPLTIIFNKSDIVPEKTSGGLSTVAVRMPSHPVANAILRAVPFPVAAPSANLSGRPSTTKAAHVIEDLSGRVEQIIDGGDVPIGVESTIIDLSGEEPVLLRYGYVTVGEMEELIGPVSVDPAIRAENIISHAVSVKHPKAPGMKYRHYAPKSPVFIVSGSEDDIILAIRRKAGKRTGILTYDEHMDCFPEGFPVSVGSIQNPEEAAHRLFDALRQFDTLPVDLIYAEDMSAHDIGGAIMNRLLKAAGGNLVRADKL